MHNMTLAKQAGHSMKDNKEHTRSARSIKETTGYT
jgi:hypothetical protein